MRLAPDVSELHDRQSSSRSKVMMMCSTHTGPASPLRGRPGLGCRWTVRSAEHVRAPANCRRPMICFFWTDLVWKHGNPAPGRAGFSRHEAAVRRAGC